MAADLSKDDVVLEIGPGLGILTEELVKHAGRVVAVEKDRRLAEILKERFKGKKNIEIVQGDILKRLKSPSPQMRGGLGWGAERETSPHQHLPPAPSSSEEGWPKGNYKLVANIPYYLTSHLIRKFLESDNPPKEMVLMIQKEVAQRICASPSQVLPSKTWEGKPPKMSLLAVSVQFYAEPKIISYVSRKSFWPQPKVDSAIIKITPYATPIHGFHTDDTDNIICVGASALLEPERRKRAFRALFFRVVRAGFAHPRKQLINNLNAELKIDRDRIAAILKKIGLEPQQRAETLNVADWIKLANSL